MYCGSAVPQIARKTAKAFYEGRKYGSEHGYCWTDGTSYFLFNNVIARRIKPEDIPEQVALALQGRPHRRPLEFTFSHWATKTTARHLKALGLRAECYGRKNPSPRFNEIEVDVGRWYTPEEISQLKPPPPRPKREPRFVNLTLPLFA